MRREIANCYNFKEVYSKRKQKKIARDQANKSIGRMPWHQEPKKDVVNCEKPW